MLGGRLRDLRLAAGKTQQDIADVLNISRSAYALYETGKRQLSYESLLTLADCYGVSLDYLFGRTEVRERLDAFSAEERRILRQYRCLDRRGRETIRTLLDFEFDRHEI